jgi:hypothetical protein
MEINNNEETKTISKKKLHRTLDAVGCGLFFIWIGIAFLADVGWGIGFIGIGVIILAMLGIRQYLTRPDDGGRTISSCC